MMEAKDQEQMQLKAQLNMKEVQNKNLQAIVNKHKQQDEISEDEIRLYQDKIEELQFQMWKLKEEYKN